MLINGADLIRTSGQQQDRVAKLSSVTSIKEVKPPGESSESKMDEETQGALLRFARFIHKDGQRKNPSQNRPTSGKKHPYQVARERDDRWYEVGQNLDIYI